VVTNGEYPVGISLDREVEAVVLIYARLPDIAGLIVLLGAERRVAEVGQKEAQLLVELGCVQGRGFCTDG
jgi:hypothetical protein